LTMRSPLRARLKTRHSPGAGTLFCVGLGQPQLGRSGRPRQACFALGYRRRACSRPSNTYRRAAGGGAGRMWPKGPSGAGSGALAAGPWCCASARWTTLYPNDSPMKSTAMAAAISVATVAPRARALESAVARAGGSAANLEGSSSACCSPIRFDDRRADTRVGQPSSSARRPIAQARRV
jgi:hypothetical protein